MEHLSFAQLLFEIIIGQSAAAVLQPLVIHDPALDGVVFYNGICPAPKLYCPLVVDLESHSNNHLEIVMLDISANLAGAFCLNYLEIPNSCRLQQLPVQKIF